MIIANSVGSDSNSNEKLNSNSNSNSGTEKDKEVVTLPPVDPGPTPHFLKSSSAKVRKNKSSKDVYINNADSDDTEDWVTGNGSGSGKSKKKNSLNLKKKKKIGDIGQQGSGVKEKETKIIKTKKSINSNGKVIKNKKSAIDKLTPSSTEVIGSVVGDGEGEEEEYEDEDILVKDSRDREFREGFNTKANQSGKFNPNPNANANSLHHSSYVEGLVPTGTSVIPNVPRYNQCQTQSQAGRDGGNNTTSLSLPLETIDETNVIVLYYNLMSELFNKL